MLQLDKWGGEKGLIEKLHTHKERGLTAKQVEISRAYYGNNAPLERKTKTICDMIMENLGDYFIILLLIAAGVELVLGVWQEGWKHGWVDGVSIFLAVIIITTVNVVNSYKTEQTFAKLLASQDDKKVEVIRDGLPTPVHVNDVVVGDILLCP
jgi:magnesium-transporting ATPase (P-type)